MASLSHRRFAIARRLLAALSLAAFIAATFGIPIVIPVRVSKNRSQPYPCMNHACGCASAEACWQSCCCFTNVQKLAWASKHGVTPPQYVFAAAAKEKIVTSTRSCCQLAAKSCCSNNSSCSETPRSEPQGNQTKAEEAEAVQDKWSLDFISAVQARRCQGQAEMWLALGAVAPPPAKIELDLTQALCGHVANFTQSIAGISLLPATPPPRV
jgi:hypothetical protein